MDSPVRLWSNVHVVIELLRRATEAGRVVNGLLLSTTAGLIVRMLDLSFRARSPACPHICWVFLIDDRDFRMLQ